MSYNLLYTETFPGGNTSAGTGANSTTGVPGETDFVGNLWSITSHVCSMANGGSPDVYAPPLDALYKASYSFPTGKLQAFSNGSGESNFYAVGRFNPASGGSGYAVSIGNDAGVIQWFGCKAVNGSQSGLTGSYTASEITFPASAYITEIVISDVNDTTTDVTCNIYLQSAPTALVGTFTFTDSSSPIQPGAGTSYWGIGTLGESSVSSFAIYQVAAAPSIGAPTCAAYKTVVSCSVAAGSGGTAPLTYQWFRNGVAIPGATSLSFYDAGLETATDYTYTVEVTDAASLTATSSGSEVTTMAANGRVIVFAPGDSIEFGEGSGEGASAADECAGVITAAGQPVALYNGSVSGTTTNDWLPNGSYLPGLLAVAAGICAEEMVSNLGVNDSNPDSQTSDSTFKSNYLSIISASFAAVPTLKKFWAMYPTYVTDSVSHDSAVIATYLPIIDQIQNGSMIIRGGDSDYNVFDAAAATLIGEDGIHPNAAGHLVLGSIWGSDMVTLANSAGGGPVSTQYGSSASSGITTTEYGSSAA